MLLSQFEQRYNVNDGWIGPYQHQDGHIMISKIIQKPITKHHTLVNGDKKTYKYTCTTWQHDYYVLYKCVICHENALAQFGYTRPIPQTCSRYGECFRELAATNSCKDPRLLNKEGLYIPITRENPKINKNGHVSWREKVYDDNGNPVSTGNGIKRVEKVMHRVVMEECLGRKLTRLEVVHHIDMDKLNNDISNLWLCNEVTHGVAHMSFTKICGELYHNYHKYSGINFNTEIGKYYLVKK